MSKVSTDQKSFLNRKEVDKSFAGNIDGITRAVGGFISDEFDCVHNNFSGKVYTGPAAILFVGRIFFFDWCQKIVWTDVVQVKRRNARSIDVVVKEPKGTTHTFNELFDVEKVWSSMVELHSQSILDAPTKPATPKEISRSLRRNNSDPNSISKAAFTFESSGRNEDTPVLTTDVTEASEEDESASASLSWTSLLNDTTSYSYIAVKDLQLKCTISAFFDLFISDSAKFSISKYMEDSGEENVECSSWTNSGNSVMKRVVNYRHPVNSPMAPPFARARKEQTCRRYSLAGIALETKTFVEDVPMTDCFFVVEMIRVAATNDNQISVTMAFDIRFVKSTMFKGIISRTTKADVEKALQGLADYMVDNLDQEKPTVASREKSSFPQEETQWTPSPTLYSYILSTMLLLMLVLQSYILWNLVSVQRDVAKLSAILLSQDFMQVK